jgi:hypothetical protein
MFRTSFQFTPPFSLMLASGLANLSTEADLGHDTLQEVAKTLAAAWREQPQPELRGARLGNLKEQGSKVAGLQ